jgi:hypothetical protein
MSHLLRNLLIALGITVLLGVVYGVFMSNDSEPAVTEESPIIGEKPDAVLQTEKLLADISKIDSYIIDDSLFEDVRFTSLQSWHVRIEDVDTGRTDPFQPVQ